MTTFDRDLFDPVTPPSPAAPAPRCTHRRDRRSASPDGGWSCECGHAVTGAKVRAGRNARHRGNRHELLAARRNGVERTGHHGGKDDYRVGGLFAFQNKSVSPARFPGWMTRELSALRREWPDLEPVLHVEATGRNPDRIYIVDEKTWLALHGPTGRTKE